MSFSYEHVKLFDLIFLPKYLDLTADNIWILKPIDSIILLIVLTKGWFIS